MLKEHFFPKIYFVRSIGTQKTAGFETYRFPRPSARSLT
jgi:hypothetical protein